jgi:hypothetical protein
LFDVMCLMVRCHASYAAHHRVAPTRRKRRDEEGIADM